MVNNFFLQFSESHCSCVFYFESIIVYKALLYQAVCRKRLITSTFGSSEPFCVKANGRVGAIPAYRVY